MNFHKLNSRPLLLCTHSPWQFRFMGINVNYSFQFRVLNHRLSYLDNNYSWPLLTEWNFEFTNFHKLVASVEVRWVVYERYPWNHNDTISIPLVAISNCSSTIYKFFNKNFEFHRWKRGEMEMEMERERKRWCSVSVWYPIIVRLDETII